MSQLFEREPLPQVGATVLLDLKDTTLAATIAELERLGCDFDLDQPFTVKSIEPDGVILISADDEFEMTIPFEYYKTAGHTLQ